MGLTLDSYLGIHAKALVAREERASVLATNIANVNTPNYKAKDMDFAELLASKMGSSNNEMNQTNSLHINPSAEWSNQIKFRVPTHTSMDGNTVDKEMETAEFTRNALSYQASLTFLNSKIKSMLMALRGE